jgi:hypothetical protein
MKTLEFYDLKSKKKFKSNDYKIVKKKHLTFAITQAPSGIKSTRIVKSNGVY